MTPHNELLALGPYGAGSNECTVMLYAWDPRSPGCRYQLNHCSRNASSGEAVCLSLADERSVRCGESGDACGARVRCDCPTGAAPVVADPSNVMVVSPSADGGRWSSGAQCSARVARLAGTGASSDEPCEISVHDCEGAECHDRWETVSCGGRATVCARPVRCECAQSALPAQ